MMATSHGLCGMAVALPVAMASPEFAPVAFLAGFLGGILPDADLYAGHRRTLHYPFLGSGAAILASGLALAFPSPAVVGLAVGVTAAALHALMDVFGGGLELRPWKGTSDRAVYSHLHGRWIAPRRAIPYDGAPADLALTGALALPLLLLGPTGAHPWILGLLLVSMGYAALRRRFADLAASIARLVPTSLQRHIPNRYLEAGQDVQRRAGHPHDSTGR